MIKGQIVLTCITEPQMYEHLHNITHILWNYETFKKKKKNPKYEHTSTKWFNGSPISVLAAAASSISAVLQHQCNIQIHFSSSIPASNNINTIKINDW